MSKGAPSLVPLASLLKSVATRESARAARVAGAVLLRQWKELLKTPGTGRVYRKPRLTRKGELKRSKRTGKVQYRTHRASAPGQPPAPDLGALRNSIQMEIDTVRAKVRVGTGIEYAPFLEFGSVRRRLKPRPHARPALEAAQREMGEAVVAIMSKPRGVGR